MIRKTISMPDEMGAWIEERVRSGQYGNDSEYFRDLVRRDQERAAATAEVEAAVAHALASGVSQRSVDQIFDAAVARYEADRKRRA
jgi:antitoxin ParD1/3/4